MDYRFLRTPRWIAGHVLLVVMVGFFIWAGFWQLSRYDDARAARDLGQERVTAAAVPLDDVADAADDPATYRRVEVTGTYLPGRQVATTPRSRDGRPGNLLLTPLEPVDGGPVVLVERGWVPFDRDGVITGPAAPPEGRITVEGVLLPAENPGTTTAFNDAGLVTFINPTAIEDDLGLELVDQPLRLLAQQPAQPGLLPVAGDVPTFELGNHLSYAVQWFAFAAVALIGYPLLVRRTAQERSDEPEPVRETIASG